jgi:WD40 repeat protein
MTTSHGLGGVKKSNFAPFSQINVPTTIVPCMDKPYTSHAGQTNLSYSRDESHVITIVRNRGIAVFNIGNNNTNNMYQPRFLAGSEETICFVLNPKHDWLASGGPDSVKRGGYTPGEIIIWNALNYTLERRFQRDLYEPIKYITFDPSGQFMFSTGGKNYFGGPLNITSCGGEWPLVYAIAGIFTIGGIWPCIVAFLPTNSSSENMRFVCTGQGNSVECVELSHENKLLWNSSAVPCHEKTYMEIVANYERVLWRTQDVFNGFVRGLVVTPFGVVLGGARNQLLLLDNDTGKVITSRKSPHQGRQVTSMDSFGIQVVTSGNDGRIRFWSMPSLEMLACICVCDDDVGSIVSQSSHSSAGEMDWEQSWVGAVRFNHDGTQVVTIAEDGFIKVWDEQS